MTPNGFAIELTEIERSHLDQIDLITGQRNFEDGRAAYLANRAPIIALLSSLFERKGIPEHRMRFWTDPTYRTGRLKGSRLDLYRRNRNVGWEPYTHPNFVPNLRYFLFGSELNADLVAASAKR